jgi:NADH-quinone oxidoreductase subunit M
MLLFLNFFILIVSVLILFFQKNNEKIKIFSALVSGTVFIFSCFMLFEDFTKIENNLYIYDYTIFKLDGLSILFFFLSTLLVFLCLIFIWKENKTLYKEYAINLLIIEFLLLIIFSSNNLLLFYVAFEGILIPMFLIIGIWGSRERKIRAVYLFFFYTLVGSIMLLLSILYIYSVTGTLNIEYISYYTFDKEYEKLLWCCFFLSFATKIPLFPLHIWLPEAHVEAPTVGSVLLAGILLKLGVYGFLRFSLVFFPESSLYFSPFILLLALLGTVYASLAAIRQTDIKRIIAYSSIAHMNLIILGIFSFNSLSIAGSIIQSISHGFVASGLFFLVGILYDRYHSRSLYYYSGLAHVMPLYSILFLLLTLSNIALPGTSSFVGEFLILLGVYKDSFFTSLLGSTGIILCGMYSLWLLNRLVFGNLKLDYTLLFSDIFTRELLVVLPLVLFSLFVGIYPYFFSAFLDLFYSELVFITL